MPRHSQSTPPSIRVPTPHSGGLTSYYLYNPYSPSASQSTPSTSTLSPLLLSALQVQPGVFNCNPFQQHMLHRFIPVSLPNLLQICSIDKASTAEIWFILLNRPWIRSGVRKWQVVTGIFWWASSSRKAVWFADHWISSLRFRVFYRKTVRCILAFERIGWNRVIYGTETAWTEHTLGNSKWS